MIITNSDFVKKFNVHLMDKLPYKWYKYSIDQKNLQNITVSFNGFTLSANEMRYTLTYHPGKDDQEKITSSRKDQTFNMDFLFMKEFYTRKTIADQTGD